MDDDRYGKFTSMAEAYRAGQRIGLQVGADNVRALLSRRGELTAEMAGAIERLHVRGRGISASLVITDEAAGWPTPTDAELRRAVDTDGRPERSAWRSISSLFGSDRS